jgi:hypothetical protein
VAPTGPGIPVTPADATAASEFVTAAAVVPPSQAVPVPNANAKKMMFEKCVLEKLVVFMIVPSMFEGYIM